MTEEQLLAKFPSARKVGQAFRALCPVHGDKNPSLTISRGTKKWLLICRSQGCSERKILDAIGLQPQDVYFHHQPRVGFGELVHPYHDENGVLRFEVVRRGTGVTKKILQRRPDPSRPGCWIWDRKGVRPILYRLPELLGAPAEAQVFLVEGERKADDLRALGLVATTNPGGAGKWRREFDESLKGRATIILPDNDDPGRRHAADVARHLSSLARSLKLLALPGLKAKGDVSDWLASGGTRAELERLVAECPFFRAPAAAKEPDANRPAKAEVPEDGGKPRQNQAQFLIELAQERVTFFRSQEDEETYASFEHAGHQATCAVGSRLFRAFLVQLHTDAVDRPPASTNVTEAITTLEAISVLGSQVVPVALRVGEAGGRLYLDLGDASWKVVEVEPHGWSIRDACAVPVRFRRSRTTRALPTPVPGGSLEELRQFINHESEDDWRLVIVFLLFCLQPRGPFPLLVVQGEQGSAKSTTTRVLRLLVDPSQYHLLRFSGRPDDFLYFARHSWLLAFDNLSGLSREASDALCGVSTGTGDARRKLYTDDELHGFNGFRPVILNGIDDVATRADLASRAITLKLPPLDPTRRRDEKEYWAEFEGAQAKILGALLSALAATLESLRSVQVQSGFRMADFGRWGTAVERALGWPRGAFATAYRANLRQTEESALEADSIASIIEGELLDRFEGRWQGNMEQLLRELNTIRPIGFRDRNWPRSPRQLSSCLERLAPLVRPRGVVVYRGQRLKHLRPWIIERAETPAEGRGLETVTTVIPSSGPRFRAPAGDGSDDGGDGGPNGGSRNGDGDDGVRSRQKETVTRATPSTSDDGDGGDGRPFLSTLKEGPVHTGLRSPRS
jgi:putative DNA primase/helicase